jgi:hypothetical protein
MTCRAFYDANVIYPAQLRDLLIGLNFAGLHQALWSKAVLEETFKALENRRPDLVTALIRTRMLLEEALPEAMVTNWSELESAIVLPDLNDRHVLAAAVVGRADVIVTFNTKDFPQVVLEPYSIEAQHPDAFILQAITHASPTVCEVVRSIRQRLSKPPVSAAAYLSGLEIAGLPQSAAALRQYEAFL